MKTKLETLESLLTQDEQLNHELIQSGGEIQDTTILEEDSHEDDNYLVARVDP